MPEPNSPAILPEPPDDLKQLSQRLSARIRARIAAGGPLPFPDYMEMALYEPGLGYYSAGLRKFGPGGDFITAPELGPVFARCLAAQVREVAERIGAYTIMEIGAGNGSLAADLLGALADGPPREYLVLERSAHLRQEQRETIARRAPESLHSVRWLDRPPEEPWQGVIVANEVLDALPVEVFRLDGDGVQRMHVVESSVGFGWRAMTPDDAWQRRVTGLLDSLPHELPPELPGGYCSEFNPHLGAWLDSVAGSLRHGCALFVDYGYPRREYYLPERVSGTLVCHYRHRAVTDPFRWPGLQDISAFVDFTALAEAGDAAGFDCAGYTSQAMFLFGCGLPDLLRDAGDLDDAERLRLGNEVRQLTLPGSMGEKFQVMALSRGIDFPLRGFSELDLSHRL